MAGTAAAWQNVDVTLSAGEVVPDRKLYLPPQSESYSHDLDGNMTGDGRWTYTWDGENRLMSASTTSGAYTAGVPGRKVDYTYDWMGRMIRRVGYSGNPITPTWTLTDDTRFVYDGWLCRWESMTNSSAAGKPWVTSIRPSTTVRSDYTGWVGMRILTGDSPVWVTRLGRWVLSGNNGSHTVKLVAANTGVDVSGGSASVDTSGASTNRFLYADLTSPIQLAANTAYYLVSLETNGGDKWYQNDTVVSPGPGLTVTHAVHGSGGSYWTSGAANNGYGPVSLVGVATTESRTQLWGLDLSGSEQGVGGVGGLLGTRTGTAATRFMAYDGNGNIAGIVDGGTGKVAATMVYSPFGEMIAREGDAERDRYGFSTKWGDGETGDCYYGYRFYTPYTGRWLSSDPIEERGGLNVGGFVANDPVSRIDGLGLLDIRPASTDPLTSITSDGCSINLVMGHMTEVGLPALDRFLGLQVSGGCSGPRIGFQTCGSDYLSAQLPKESVFVIPDNLWGRGDARPMDEDEERRVNELRRSLPNVRNLPYISRSNTTTASVSLYDGSRLLDYVKANACKETCCKTVKIVGICSQRRTQDWDRQAAAIERFDREINIPKGRPSESLTNPCGKTFEVSCEKK